MTTQINTSAAREISEASVRDYMQLQVGSFLGKNIRNYRYTTYLGTPRYNQMFGTMVYLMPAEGRVCSTDDRLTLVKVEASKFCVIATELLDQVPTPGDKVLLSFYQLRRFDGTLADGSEDQSIGGVRTISLTQTKTKFPCKWEGRHLGINEKFADQYVEIQNPYLRDMIQQMETLEVNDGMRRVVNILIDAKGNNLHFNDSDENNIISDPPGISCDVSTTKFAGNVNIFYDRGADTYSIGLTPIEGEHRVIEDVHFNELGDKLIEKIDDGRWKMVKVTMLKPAPKPKKEKTTAGLI